MLSPGGRRALSCIGFPRLLAAPLRVGVAILVSESLRCVRHASVCGHGGQAFVRVS